MVWLEFTRQLEFPFDAIKQPMMQKGIIRGAKKRRL